MKLAGESGIVALSRFDATDYDVRVAAEIQSFVCADIADRKERRYLDDFSLYALVAATEAVRDAGLTVDPALAHRGGVVVGSGFGGLGSFERNHDLLLRRGPGRVGPHGSRRRLRTPGSHSKAGFTLGWQLLLQSRYFEAGVQFQRIASSAGDDPLALRTREQARLLEAQCLMWSGQLDLARDRLAGLVDAAPQSSLADDAERDLAWCDYQQGNIDEATRRLRAAIESQGATHKADRAGDLSVAWPAVAAHGLPVFKRELRRAYGRHPRSTLPMSFLLSVGDRFAAPDARRLLRSIGSRAVIDAQRSAPSVPPRKPVRGETWATPTNGTWDRSVSHGLWLALAFVLLAATILVARRRRDTAGRSR